MDNKPKARRSGTRLRLYRDGQIILEANDDRVAQGAFLIAVDPGAIVQFDESKAEQLTS
jgi:hypothetical protein